MANVWRKLYNKTNKSTYDISKEMNIPEEKVKEVIKGEREVPTDKVDEMVSVLSTNNVVINSMERALMEKFFQDKDISQLKKEFGYQTMEELAKAIGVGVSSLYKFRGDYFKAVSDSQLKKVYDWFHDGFNKKLLKQVPKPEPNKAKYVRLKYFMIRRSELSSEVTDWYFNTDIIALLREEKITGKELTKKIGYDLSYYSVAICFISKTERIYKYANWGVVQQLYNYYHGLKLFNVMTGEYTDSEKEEITPNIVKEENVVEVEPMDIPTTIEKDVEEKKPTICVDTTDCISKQQYIEMAKELERYKYLIDKLISSEKNHEN